MVGVFVCSGCTVNLSRSGIIDTFVNKPVFAAVSDYIAALLKLTDTCLTRDRHFLRMQLRNLQRPQTNGKGRKQKQLSLDEVARRIQASTGLAENRQAAAPQVTYPEALPMTARIEELKTLIASHQVVIVAGETGSGKTTQLPKICLDLGRGIRGMIGHTQPRRLAARTVCSRIGEELGVSGSAVAYQVRFQDYSDDQTYIKLMTDGILLSETRDDPFLNKYDTIIIDEAHERSLNIDFLLGYLKRLLPKRPDLKLIVTSATIDVEKFSAHFDQAPILEVSGRTYPVDIIYQPEREDDEDLTDQVVRALRDIRVLSKNSPLPYQDVLVFLSGEKEIRDAAEAIRKDKALDLEVLPLYARLSNKEQNRVFQSHAGQRVVLSTNVAETSLTVPGIGYVIDTGTARISRYSVRSKIQRLPIEPVSQASANQRAGRCGRLCPGTCFRLYAQEDFISRPAFTDTEITRTNLASVILQMLVLRLGDIESFPFIDPPEGTAIKDGFKILEELGAVNEQHRITPLGRQMARFPVDPRLARILLAGEQYKCLEEMLIVVSALSIQDPRERPLDKQQAADEKHGRFRHVESDFVSWITLWTWFEEERQQVGRNRLGKFCHQNFLSYLRMNEWREVHRQLRLISQELGLALNKAVADYEQIHRALLAGLVSHVASRTDEQLYLGARNRKFRIFPGSNLFGKKHPWILAAELVETSQLYARMNARVEPEWIENQAGSLLKYDYSEPHWEKKQGKVMAFEKVTLYGLVLADKRRKPFGPIDPVVSREIFIREGLARSAVNTRVECYRHNSRLIADIENLEEKTRRKDILVRDTDIYRLYDERLPAEVIDQPTFERWIRKLPRSEEKTLFFAREDLLNTDEEHLNLDDFPDQIQAGHLNLDVGYQFSPGRADDGISVDVPVSVLMQVREADLDWLVPGMLREKCIAMVKALPKSLRKNFVPVPDYVDQALPMIRQGEGDLKAVLAHQLHRLSAISIPEDAWQDFVLPEHLRMKINVLGDKGELLGSGRDLVDLQSRYAEQSRAVMADLSASTIEQTGLEDWSFDTLDEVYEIRRGGLTLLSWPALVDQGDSVDLRLMDSPELAVKESRAGIARLYMLRNRQQWKYLDRQLLQDVSRFNAIRQFGGRDALARELILASYQAAFGLDRELPRDRDAYDRMYEAGRGTLVETSTRLEAVLYNILEGRASVQSRLKKFKGLGDMEMLRDVHDQLDNLVYEGFLAQTPVEILRELPRYLQAIEVRLDKYPRQPDKDREWRNMLQRWWQKFQEKAEHFARQQKTSRSLSDFRWMLEELRVSLFAQTVGTRYPVSEKRLEKAWADIE